MDRIPVMEQFYSLQGEGQWTGSPAYFIRLAGCDVGCHWCDVKESWEVKEDQWKNPAEIVADVMITGANRVVITGGEPTIYDLTLLTTLLREKKIQVHLETSGAYPILGHFDWICLSPKKFKAALEVNFKLAHELKVIVYNHHDLKWAVDQATRTDPSKTLWFLQPEWSKHENVQFMVEWIRDHPQWRLSLQTHKFLNIP